MTAEPPDDHFDLRTRPWIPVRTKEGASSIGLRDLFLDAHRIDGLAVALPPAASGLMRVLCAMAARITTLHTASNNDDWQDLRYDLLEASEGFDPSSVDAYLGEHGSRLRLHDPIRPFLQDPRLVDQSPNRSGVNKLVMARPAGNNQVFFGHFTDDEQVALPSAEAALHLIAQLYYGPSGQCTPRTVSGKRFGNTVAGPLRRSLSYHPAGRSLFETLLLGIPAPGTWPRPGRSGPVGTAPADSCPWEREELPDPLAPPSGAVGPLSALTEQYQHAILLQPGPDRESVVDATITWAFRENRPPHTDPFLIWDEAKDGTLRARDAEAERSLWRDLDALVLMNRGDSGKRPLILDGLVGGQIPEAAFRSLRVSAYGFDQDGQTRDRTYFSASTPPLFALLETSEEAGDNVLALGVKEGREAAEKAAQRMEFALRSAWRSYTTPFSDDKPGRNGKGGGPWPGVALAAYWPAAEERFWDSLDSGDFTHALSSFGRLALEIYDEVTRPVASTPRGAKAREGARGLVRSLLDRSTS
ncbi:type I-E CRISPR-associated protein Cse1/CasA [Peterkaempfera bronchialis]|uniref:Type I-E CRISPR-associated protein Cse1/CasA n=1 Tax=Peterkaempfera bronchialis TaxID=2126346 RepID=A0A345T1G0_9ACTN|nr:type I-E CRISPR-associated protein Cse1/CasA [Peterkaempfera bronchialis]AXI79815.1 type I-E CRISPR-associated protein Cse1/CasA [Peterkaempfera bronchialis]